MFGNGLQDGTLWLLSPEGKKALHITWQKGKKKKKRFSLASS
jgi:hypothetical protein